MTALQHFMVKKTEFRAALKHFMVKNKIKQKQS